MTRLEPKETRKQRKRISRRAFLTGAAVGGVAAWAGATLPRRAFLDDPQRPPQLYEYFLDSVWFDSVDLYGQRINAPLKGAQRADIAIVGGGFAGMATAYNLARRLPGKRIVLLEGACCGYGASGRNGGFADAGMPGLQTVYEAEGPEAARAYYDATLLGMEQIRSFVDEHGVDCDLEENGAVALAVEPAQMEALEAQKSRYDAMGLEATLLDGPALRRLVASERFVGGLRDPRHAILNPAKLARGMKRVIEGLGVEVFERSKVLDLEPGASVRILTEFGEVSAPIAVVTLNGYAPRLGLFRNRVIPLCNYVVATEPLADAQLAAIGWAGRESLADMRVQFMYLRLTADNRIVFGGESSPYFYGGSPSSGNYRPSLEKLRRSLLVTFPQLEGVRFSHGWGGTMGFTMDFMPSVGALEGARNLFYAVGFNGEGVVMTQLAGRILAELIAGEQTALTRLPLVSRRMPYVVGEPLRYPILKLYERALRLWGSNPVR
ncbi:MAG: FAD-dependent oxidoreductase [Deltaproteobacteria bacterium]|nr:FAD-dependent oxidoreductase [Deltaproteobacteria bacterium]